MIEKCGLWCSLCRIRAPLWLKSVYLYGNVPPGLLTFLSAATGVCGGWEDILGNLTTIITKLQQEYPDIVLCINTAHLATRSHVYKSEDFLVIELLKRGRLEIPIWNLDDYENLPSRSILLDDACYSGGQLRKKSGRIKRFS